MSFAGYFLSVLLCHLSMLISDSRFDLVWFRLSCDHGWIRSGSVNVRKQQQQQQQLAKYIRRELNRSIRYAQFSFGTRKFGKSSVVCTHFSRSSLQATYGHLLVQASYSQFDHFSNSGQTGLASSNKLLKCYREFSFQYNGLLWYRACVRSPSLRSTLCEEGKSFFTWHIADINTPRVYKYSEFSHSDQTVVVLKRSNGHTRYPPQVQHPLQTTNRMTLSGTILLERTTLAARTRLCADWVTQISFEITCLNA